MDIRLARNIARAIDTGAISKFCDTEKRKSAYWKLRLSGGTNGLYDNALAEKIRDRVFGDE